MILTSWRPRSRPGSWSLPSLEPGVTGRTCAPQASLCCLGVCLAGDASLLLGSRDSCAPPQRAEGDLPISKSFTGRTCKTLTPCDLTHPRVLGIRTWTSSEAMIPRRTDHGGPRVQYKPPSSSRAGQPGCARADVQRASDPAEARSVDSVFSTCVNSPGVSVHSEDLCGSKQCPLMMQRNDRGPLRLASKGARHCWVGSALDWHGNAFPQARW